jgi:hypothetical protein
VLDEPATTVAMVEAGKARAEEFSMARLAERYAEIYARLA